MLSTPLLFFRRATTVHQQPLSSVDVRCSIWDIKMAEHTVRRVNTICIELVRGTLSGDTMNVLLPNIIRDTYGIPNEELYGVALNGLSRIFVKFLRAGFYTRIVEQYQEQRMSVNSAMDVVLHDVSKYYTWVKVRNVPFEATAYGLQEFFRSYGTVHSATMGVWRDGPYEGMPEGSYTLKMSLTRPIPSYVTMTGCRTQVYVYYAGQRKTCRLCSSYEHMAAQCPRRQAPRILETPIVIQQSCDLVPGSVASGGRRPDLWSQEVDREVAEEETCVTIPGESGESKVLSEESLVQEASTQEGLLADVIKDFLDGDEPGVEGVLSLCEVGELEGQQIVEKDLSKKRLECVVAVEVHQEDSSEGEMCVSGSSRKRTAASEIDEVITPGQRPGKKSWAAVVEPMPHSARGAPELHSGRGRGEVTAQDNSSGKGIRNVKSAASKSQRHRGKPPLL